MAWPPAAPDVQESQMRRAELYDVTPPTEVPPHVLEDLRAIRGTFELRWNPKSRMVAPPQYDALGRVEAPAVHEGRWELWDNPDSSPAYMILRLEGIHQEFRPPGDWIVHYMRKINPARFGGDLNRMVAELMTDPDVAEAVAEREFDEFCEALSEWAYYCQLPKTSVPDQLTN